MPLFDTRNRAIILAQSAVAVPLTGSASETTLATITIPAGAMGLNGRVMVTTLWSFTNNANIKTCVVKFGGTSGTYFASVGFSSVSATRLQHEIANRNSASSQVGHGPGSSSTWGSTNAAITTASVNTAVAVDLVIRGQLASSGDTMTLESYRVELFYGA